MKKQLKKMTGTLLLSILGGLVAIGAGIAQFYENKKSEEVATENENRARQAERQLLEKAEALIEAQKEIVKLQEQQNQLLVRVDARAEKTSKENALTGKIDLRLSGLKLDDQIIRRFGGEEGATAINSYSQMIQWKPKFISVGQEDLIKVRIVDNKMVISLTWYNLKGEWIVEIVDNFWRRNPTNTGKFNYDDKGFEVVDNQGNIALNLNFRKQNEIIIQGYIYTPQNGLIAIGGKNGVYVPKKTDNDVSIIQKMKEIQIIQLFEYSGEGWLGKRRK
jgi:hypothetical protein